MKDREEAERSDIFDAMDKVIEHKPATHPLIILGTSEGVIIPEDSDKSTSSQGIGIQDVGGQDSFLEHTESEPANIFIGKHDLSRPGIKWTSCC